jgi:ABC-2 type transport system ATP-binding protein
VHKSFGRVDVLRGIDLEIPAGACMGLAGVNGAGKTTLIKCLLDFCDLDSGTIEIQGVEHRRPASRGSIAFLPERFIPPYFLSGREFITTMLRLLDSSRNQEDVNAMFDALDLESAALEKPVRSYSKGMTQKLGLAVCFLSGKELYVLDEPLSGLDPKARSLVKTLLQKLKSEGRTVFLTSHSLADVEEICDHMTVLDRGMIAYSGTPRGLGERYGKSSLEQAFLECIETHA